MRNPLIAIAALGAVTATAAYGQAASTAPPKDAASYWGVGDLQAIVKAVPMKDGKPAGFSKRLYSVSSGSTAYIRLTAPDTPHAHGTWAETFVVTAGSGVLETGGKITGVTGTNSATHGDIFVDQPATPRPPPNPAAAARQAASGDLAGADIEGGHKQAVKPGDVILIPAGVAHRWSQVDGSVTYLDIKFPPAQ